MSGILNIVATPIGNLEDVTFRAIRILKEADLILAEDTRVTSILLRHYDIDTPIVSYHQHSKDNKKLEILSHLVQGENVALVTDAGTPGISDPGSELIDFLLEKEPDLRIIPIPGASAVVTALSVSGFRSDKFVFLGFLPKKKKQKLYKWLIMGEYTFAFYESPKRIVKSLSEIHEVFGDRRIFIARELTKMHETLYRGKTEKVLQLLSKTPLKGEIVVVVEGK